jgi:hypothetical protein
MSQLAVRPEGALCEQKRTSSRASLIDPALASGVPNAGLSGGVEHAYDVTV